MTRREWVWALAAGLGVGLLPGCLQGPRSAPKDDRSAMARPVALESLPASAPATPERASPYSVVPTQPVIMSPEANGPISADLPVPPTPPPEVVGSTDPEPHSNENGSSSEAETLDILKPIAVGSHGLVGEQAISIYPTAEADPPLVAALRGLVDKRPDDAAARLREFDKANQEVLLCLLPLAVRLSQGALDRTAPGELTVMVDQADSVAAPLRRRAPLVIDKMCFCRRIDKFGQYEPLPDQHQFRPGELVQVYAELRNFSSDPGKAGFETRLASSVRLTSQSIAGPEIVWRQDFHDRDRVDHSRSPRRDYFNNYRFCIPENLPRGNYKLWLRVIDVPTGRSAEGSLPLTVSLRGGP